MPKKGESTIEDRLHRIEGQIRGVERMVESDQELDKVLTQLQAVISSLESVKLQLVKRSIKKNMEEKVLNVIDVLK
jgi:DNA-binding FrmR family transcriptional regulator